MTTIVVVPWHQPDQVAAFCRAWGIEPSNPAVLLQQDRTREGCARTKNRGIARALAQGVETIIVLDDDCLPTEGQTLETFIAAHQAALAPQPVPMMEAVTSPPSRGTPYYARTIEMPVAASMGFWEGIPDYDAPGQLVYGATYPMAFRREAMHGRYFPLCGMNLAFRASEWPWCQFIDVPRFDDIWQGFLWQRRAYADGKCFNLAGPLVRHARQSNVWHNLRQEAQHLERNETLWQEIHRMPLQDYNQMVAQLLLPAPLPAASTALLTGPMGLGPPPPDLPPRRQAPDLPLCPPSPRDRPGPEADGLPSATGGQAVAGQQGREEQPLEAASLLEIPPQPEVQPPWPATQLPGPPVARQAQGQQPATAAAAAGAVSATPPGCEGCGSPLGKYDKRLCPRCAFQEGQ